MAELDKTEEQKKVLEVDANEERSVQYDLTDEQKEIIVAQIIKEIEYEELSRQEYMSMLAESTRLLEGIRDTKSDPWVGCSNITTMLIPAHVKLMHARLFPAVWNPNLVYYRPAERSDIDNVDNVKKFMHWVVRHDIDMQNIADDGVNQAISDGTVIFKVRWLPEYRWVAKRNFEGMKLFGGIKEKIVYEYRKFERAKVDIVEVEDFLQSGLDVQACSYVIQSCYNTLADLKEMETKGIFIKGSVTAALDAKLDEMVTGGSREVKEQAEGYARIQALKNVKVIRTVERYGKWEINGDIVDSVFTIAYETETYLSGKPLVSVNRLGRRPFVVGPLIRRVGRWMGQGIPDLLSNLQKEVDAIHNQRIDAGTMSVAPFGVYRAASSFRPEVVKIGPGVLIPVDDVKDIQLMQFPANFQFSYQEERMIIEYIEKLTVMSSYSFGQESNIVKSRATATSTMALLSQAEQALTILGARLQHTFSELLTMILQYYQMYMPPGLAERVLGEDSQGKLGLLFDDGLTPETIAGNYDAFMELDVSGGNKAVEQQTAQIMFGAAPALLQLVADPRGWEIAADFLRKLGYLDVEKYLGPKPEAQQPGGTDVEALAGLLGKRQTDQGTEETGTEQNVGGATAEESAGQAA